MTELLKTSSEAGDIFGETYLLVNITVVQAEYSVFEPPRNTNYFIDLVSERAFNTKITTGSILNLNSKII